MQAQENFQKNYQQGRSGAIIFAGIVYVGVVISVTVLFINFILSAFAATDYFSRGLLTVSGFLVGCSMLAFPVALHNWAVSGWHRGIAIGFYFGEILIVGLNTVVSFTVLLYARSGAPLPGWVAWYEPFSIGAIVYTIFAWGTIFLTDPQIKAKAKEKETFDRITIETAQMMGSYIHSEAGKRAIKERADQKLDEIFKGKRPEDEWNTVQGKSGIPCQYCGIPNPPGAAFCSQCGGASTPRAAAPALPYPSPAPQAPGLPRKRQHSTGWTLRALLSYAGIDAAQAREMIRQYQLFDARSAYSALDNAGYIPESLTLDGFMPLFCELAGVNPTWDSISNLHFSPTPNPADRPAVTYYPNREDYLARVEADRITREAGKNNGAAPGNF